MNIPAIDAAAWRLQLAGDGVAQELVLTLEQLRQGFEPVELVSVCQCAGRAVRIGRHGQCPLEGRATALVRDNCSSCHSLDYSQLNSPFVKRAAWEASVRLTCSSCTLAVRLRRGRRRRMPHPYPSPRCCAGSPRNA